MENTINNINIKGNNLEVKYSSPTQTKGFIKYYMTRINYLDIILIIYLIIILIYLFYIMVLIV